ncbi:bidirectional sugar transporter SWEET8-like [Capsella rubella]|uniref:bidirectional sugar transporter SWEET8-like n=1 Tax=Capsella rubella TaxID=81985 RepID=UPI000CD49EDD|nr:bidirectional sugar transporter SWEET8-like [Capsella rubella]
MLMKCSLWFLYGLPLVQNDNILVTITNGIGFLIQVIYLVLFLIYCGDELQSQTIWHCLGFEFVFVFFFYGVTLGVIESLPSRHTFIGVVCNVFTIVMYATFVMKTMVEKQSFKCMPDWLSSVSFINATIWTAYSVVYKIDIYLLISNGLEALLCAWLLIVNALQHTTTEVNYAGATV